jgi:tetratricopeptide (TPR) repeat protein
MAFCDSGTAIRPDMEHWQSQCHPASPAPTPGRLRPSGRAYRGSTRDPERALSLARRAVELDPAEVSCVNTLGVALYRAGRYAEAITRQEKCLASSTGGTDAYDLLFLAMARYEIGEKFQARADFDRALTWRRDHPNLPPDSSRELDSFQARARAVLEDELGLPADVFGPEAQSRP